jgi:hypothetical protein
MIWMGEPQWRRPDFLLRMDEVARLAVFSARCYPTEFGRVSVQLL